MVSNLRTSKIPIQIAIYAAMSEKGDGWTLWRQETVDQIDDLDSKSSEEEEEEEVAQELVQADVPWHRRWTCCRSELLLGTCHGHAMALLGF